MAIPTIFTQHATDKIISYDYFDFFSGVGYKNLYAIGGYDDAATQFFLSPQLIESDPSNCKVVGNVGGVELNFDVTFNTPMTIAAADAFLNIHISASGAGNHLAAVAVLYHVSPGAVETQIGAETSRTHTSGGAEYSQFIFKFACTKTYFAIGDKLRLSITYSADAATGYMYFDYANNYELTLSVPFEVIN